MILTVIQYFLLWYCSKKIKNPLSDIIWYRLMYHSFPVLCNQVNLKEQGQLRCQDEFIVWCGRKKYLRHVFLFEDLILFSKTKKIEGGYDIYIYKQSYKVQNVMSTYVQSTEFLLWCSAVIFASFQTAEIGMTENVGDSGLRFEIWFRRRKSQDTFILQASSGEVKAAWTSVIGKILWRQALRNRGQRAAAFNGPNTALFLFFIFSNIFCFLLKKYKRSLTTFFSDFDSVIH